MDTNKSVLISALMMSLFALPVAADEFQFTFTGNVENPPSGLPYVVSFNLDTGTGTQTISPWPNGTVLSVLANNLAVTNFSAVLNGVPFATLPSATGRFAGESSGPGPGQQFFEPLLSVNNVFSWDFLSNPTNLGTQDVVTTLLLDHTIADLGGTLGSVTISMQTMNIVDLTRLHAVPEPGTLSLFLFALPLLFVKRWAMS